MKKSNEKIEDFNVMFIFTKEGFDESYSAIFEHGKFHFYHFDKNLNCIESKENINFIEMSIFLELLAERGFRTTKIYQSGSDGHTTLEIKEFLGIEDV